MSDSNSTTAPPIGGNFIRDIIVADNATGKFQNRVVTRFPPEPNGYLHIGHAKAICIDFGLAKEFGGTTNLRFDDTNPTTEDVEYVDAIQDDIKWLGFEWSNVFFASDYFEQLYQIAEKLIGKGLAYVDSLNEEQIREYRGNFYKKGRPSPFRERSVDENLDLFRRMRAGEFKEGEHVLRAKIDLETQNMNLRDPLMYRIRYAPHHRTGKTWCIYPMYDYAHPLSDSIEKITHSICTLEFEAHRPLYDWCIREAEMFPSQQIEFARLHLTYTVMSKRKLLELVQKNVVNGWTDPRMPTLAGMRRRGYTAPAIRAFCERVGVAKADSVVDVGLLEFYLREDLNASAPRVMAVLRPLRVVLENIVGDHAPINAPYFADDATHSRGARDIPFGRELYIEHDDFMEEPPKDFYRLAPGREVRLRHAGIIRCDSVVKDDAGKVVELRCTHLGASVDRPIKGTIHWVSATQNATAEVRLYDRLFAVERPGMDENVNFLDEMNPKSLEVVTAHVELAIAKAEVGARFQFERIGYFCVDSDSTDAQRIWNRTVSLKDTWAKIVARDAGKKPAPPTVKAPKAEKPKAAPPPPPAEIGIEDFAKLDLRVAIIREATLVEEAKKLLCLKVDLGEEGGRLRQIFAGLRADYPEPSVLVGKRVIVVANLKPRQMKFGLSEGMVLAAGSILDSDRPHRVATFDDAPDAPAPGDKIA